MSGFEQSQQDYYLRQINRAIPVTSRTTDLGTIQAALGVIDPAMPEGTTATTDAVQFMSTFGRKTDAMTRDAECHALPIPGDAMRSDTAARTGCGWWFVPDVGAPSVGAYGTRRGPMNPRMDEQFGAGQWLWDPRQAQQQEELKRASRVKDCASMSASTIANRLAWCADTGMAVVVDATGYPQYPKSAGGDCPSTPTRTCPAPPSSSGGGGGSSSGGGGGGCQSNPGGPMSPACIQQYITNPIDSNKYSACSTNGFLYNSLNGTYATGPTFSGLDYYMQNDVPSPGGIKAPSAITADQIGAYTTALVRASADTTTRVGTVAHALCYGGAAIDPCAPPMLSPSDRGFPLECVTQKALSMNYSADGGIMPSQIGSSYWTGSGQGQVGGTWQNALDNLAWWKQSADNPNPTNPNAQANAIWNVYGVSVKYPRTGCNNTGMYIYRYYYNTADPGTVFNGTAGPHTHFLGRYIVKQGETFLNTVASSSQMMPAGSTLVEGQRYSTIFRPTSGGSYQFMFAYDDYIRISLYDNTGAPILQSGWQTAAGSIYTSPTVNIVADQEYNMRIDFMNIIDAWTNNLQVIINGQGPTAITSDQFYLPYDRRQPMVELAFNKMPIGTGTRDNTTLQQVSDTNGVFQNLAFMRNANIGTLGGKTCMLVNNGGIYNFNKFSQGFRGRAFKSMALMINVTSFQNSADGRTAPSLISFYNVAGRDPTAPVLQVGPPAGSWNYGNRTQDLSIFMSGGNAAFQYKDARDPSILTQYFYNTVPLPTGQWHHIAIVWDDDFQGYAFFMDGALKGQLRATGPGVSQMFEQMRIGSDATDDGAGWQGGIAWFRAFDYRLSMDQIQMDMNDNWASLN
jgi:hypothetical protein